MSSLRAAAHWLVFNFQRYLPRGPGPRWPALSPLAARVERLVHLLDSAVAIPGTRLRLGLDPVLGLLLPGVGDFVGGVVSLGVMFLAWLVTRLNA